jgi:hypothetical protein
LIFKGLLPGVARGSPLLAEVQALVGRPVRAIAFPPTGAFD